MAGIFKLFYRVTFTYELDDDFGYTAAVDVVHTRVLKSIVITSLRSCHPMRLAYNITAICYF